MDYAQQRQLVPQMAAGAKPALKALAQAIRLRLETESSSEMIKVLLPLAAVLESRAEEELPNEILPSLCAIATQASRLIGDLEKGRQVVRCLSALEEMRELQVTVER